jgi:hypothetical protein
MPVKLSTTISTISLLPNPATSTLLDEFYQYMKSIETSESYQNGNLKIIIYFARFLGPTDFLSIHEKEFVALYTANVPFSKIHLCYGVKFYLLGGTIIGLIS